ncbi:hypothetical protein JHK87_048051 [Glycine soja]|nr:hypothetical protein JHK87_048051 [Glycine soja]
MLPEIQMLLIPKQNQQQPNLSFFSLLLLELELELDHKNSFENHCSSVDRWMGNCIHPCCKYMDGELHPLM